jgi:hypothetical protein
MDPWYKIVTPREEVREGRSPAAQVGVFVGNAWDPQAGRETPWLDLARPLAGENGFCAIASPSLPQSKAVF